MDVLVLIAVFGTWLILGVVVWLLRRERRSGPEPEPAAVTGVGLDAADDLDVRTVGDAVELWWPGGAKLATIRATDLPDRGSALRSPWVRRAVGTLLKRSGSVVRGNTTRYRLTFPPDLMSTLAGGGTVDVALRSGTSLPALGSRMGGAALGGPALALAAGAVAMSVAQQQRLDKTLVVIEARLDHLIDRMRDDDHGRLDAAESLLEQLETRTAELPSAQFRAELAAARQTVDAVYFARRRFAERLGDAIGDAQNASEDQKGEIETWADGVLEAVGDPAQLRSELLVYLRSLVVRARLATSTAGVLAIDGDLADANQLLTGTVAELRGDFYSIYRRLRPLAEWAPKRALPWKRKEWDRAHTTVVEVFELMAGEVEPLLPDENPKPIELVAKVDEAGVVEELEIVE